LYLDISDDCAPQLISSHPLEFHSAWPKFNKVQYDINLHIGDEMSETSSHQYFAIMSYQSFTWEEINLVANTCHKILSVDSPTIMINK